MTVETPINSQYLIPISIIPFFIPILSLYKYLPSAGYGLIIPFFIPIFHCYPYIIPAFPHLFPPFGPFFMVNPQFFPIFHGKSLAFVRPLIFPPPPAGSRSRGAEPARVGESKVGRIFSTTLEGEKLANFGRPMILNENWLDWSWKDRFFFEKLGLKLVNRKLKLTI